ncbi:MAG: trypsin-like peptidase domain-containing protein [Campylobacterota bacterium]|nr:trypsin-like peptidase domain-containing protein [Campylobacterota bacterium]
MIRVLTLTLFFLSSLIAQSSVKDSIVKIYTVSKIPNYAVPWNSNIKRSHGSGSIIDGNRILTNAHVVANETFIEVKRYGQTQRYEAELEFISHQADLALLRVKDETFFKGTKSLKFGVIPKVRQEVTVYGFPMGGNSLSVSTGIVSRIEHNRYAHSREIFLSIQVDAAVNPGNSGGPAISDGKIVGVVMQQITKSQNIGYLVPTEIIEHFLDDIKDGKYNGFAHLGVDTQKMENETLREVYAMDKELSGVMVMDISQKSSAFNVLKKDDILLSIDGHTIENDGTVEFLEQQFTSFKYYVDKKQLGETIAFEVLRDAKIIELELQLTNIADDNLLVNTLENDVMPKYLIYDGYVFTPLTRNLFNGSRSTLLKLREAAGKWACDEKEEVVILLKVLADKTNRGDHNFSLWIVDMVNSQKFKNFDEFKSIIQNFKGKYLILENEDGVKLAIDRQNAVEREKSILQRYSIKSSQNE